MRLLLRLSLSAGALFSSASPAVAQLSALEAGDLRLVYFKPAQSFLAPHVARCFQNSMRFHRELFSYEPSEKVTVVLTDFSDEGNAFAGAVPNDYVRIEIAPLSFAFETVVGNERINWLMSHELVHVTVADQAAPSDRFFRGLFGGKVAPLAEHPESILYFYLTLPRDAAPRWHAEGLAVFLETWMAGGRGRAQGAYDEMVFRSMVRDGSRFYDPLGLVSEGTKIDFQTEVNSYLYGTRFMSYLAYQYSPESVIRWASRAEGSAAYYASQFRKVYGLSLEEAWQDWIVWEKQFQQANLDAIRQYPVTPFSDLSRQALGSVSRAYFDGDREKLYAGFNYPGVVAHVGAISLEDGSVEKIIEVKGPSKYTVTSLAFDPERKILFYTTDNYGYRDLRSVDPATKKSRTLLKDVRVGELVFNRRDGSLWGVRAFNGIATLVVIPRPYKEWKQVRSWPYGQVVYDLDISPDGQLLSASVGEISGRQTLRVMKIESLLAGDDTVVASHEFGAAIPSNFTFSQDGRYLYGSSYYTGASNIFRFELETGALDALSNSETGLFRPIHLGGDSLIVLRYTGEGFIPARIEATPIEDVSAITFLGYELTEKHPIVKDWKLDSFSTLAVNGPTAAERRYSALGSLGLASLYPVVVGYKDFAGPGLRLNLSDPALINQFGLTVSYTPDSDLPGSERVHVNAEYERYDWELGFQLNGADFYDLFGPTKTSLKGYAARLGYRKALVYDEPRFLDLEAELSYYGDLERLPDFQNVATSFDRLLAARAKLGFRNLRHSLGHVDEEKGVAWSLAFAGDRVEGETFPKFRSDLDLGLPLPIKHSSVWLRSSAGYSTGERDEPFANFYFGGFGNNWVDHREEKRYREWYSFPGTELNEISGTNYARSMFEWNLPPIRFRRAGSPGFYLTWARPALFASGLVTNMDEPSLRRVVSNVGAQLDFRFTVLSRLEMTLSAGHALAFEDGERPRNETMVSLKLLR